MKFGKDKAKLKRKELQQIENNLKRLEEKIANEPKKENIKQHEIGRINYENVYDYITRGTILRSRANWYENGEKITNTF